MKSYLLIFVFLSFIPLQAWAVCDNYFLYQDYAFTNGVVAKIEIKNSSATSNPYYHYVYLDSLNDSAQVQQTCKFFIVSNKVGSLPPESRANALKLIFLAYTLNQFLEGYTTEGIYFGHVLHELTLRRKQM